MEPRARKSGPHYHQIRQDWRSKSHTNQASRRYRRDFILKHYPNLLPPAFNFLSEIQEVYLQEASPPLLSAFFPFSHSLGEEPNSRKHPVREKRPEQVPEWYEDSSKPEVPAKPSKPERLDKAEKSEGVSEGLQGKSKKPLEDFDEKFTEIDRKVEEKLKNENKEEEEAPNWDEPDKEEFKFEEIKPVVKEPVKPIAPVIKEELLRYHCAIGNPFAQTLFEYKVPYAPGSFTFAQNSKPFEKIWHYKDLANNIHGPFSTLDMFCWTIRDCFPYDLQISIGGSGFFVPMNIFNDINPQTLETEFYGRDGNKTAGKVDRKTDGKVNRRNK